MSPSPNHHRKRWDTLELEGDRQAADAEELKKHLPELFDSGFYLGRIQGDLKRFSSFTSSEPIKKCLTEEGQGQLDAYTAYLAVQLQESFRKYSFEFDIQHESEKDEEGEFVQNHKIIVAVADINKLLSAFDDSISDLDTLRQFNGLIDHLRSVIDLTKGKLPNFREHIKEIEIEIKVLKDELSDLLEQEKETGLNEAEKNQKRQLKTDINSHHQGVSKNKKKLKRQQVGISERSWGVFKIR